MRELYDARSRHIHLLCRRGIAMQGDRLRGLRSSRIWLVRGALGLVLLAVCGRPSAGQGGTPERTPPAPAAENPWVSEEQAVATAGLFAQAGGLPWEEAPPSAVLQAAQPGGPARWIIRSARDGKTVSQFVVDAAEGCISYACNTTYSAKQTTQVKLSSRDALARATEIARLMGVEERLLVLRRIELAWDPEPGGEQWRVDWGCVLDEDRQGGFATVVLNAESGALLQVTRAWRPDGSVQVRGSSAATAGPSSMTGGNGTGAESADRHGVRGSQRMTSGSIRTYPVTPHEDGRRHWRQGGSGGMRPPMRDVAAKGSPGRADTATRYLVGAIAGMAAVVIIVLVVVWPRHGGVSRSDR